MKTATTFKGQAKPFGKSGHFNEPTRHALQAKGIKTGNNADMLFRYESAFGHPQNKTEFFRVDDVPASVAEKAFLGEPKLNPNGRQNDSPTMRSLVKTALEHKATLEGYVIPQESGRDDARVTFDGIVIPKKAVAYQLKKTTHPDEFGKVKGGYRLWWD